ILSGGCPFAGSFTLGGGGECMDTIVDLFIDFDSWPDEVTWDLTDDLGNVLYAGGPGSGDTYSESYCLADGNYIFNIYDAWGDGIYCTGGYYELSTGGNIIAGGPGVGCDYGEGESTPFTIPFGGTGECTDLVLYMYDSYGDGWNGNYFVATDADGNVLVEETLSTGSYGEVYFCLDDGAYWVTVDDGSWQSEVSWEVFDLAGNLILGGGCPFGGFLLVNVPEPVLGCTDPDAMNYNPDATWDDGSCNYDCLDIPFTIWIFTASWGSEISWDLTDSGGNIVAFGSDYSSNSSYSYDLCLPEGWYVFNMYDSYGDGWNGGYAEFWDENGFVFFSETLDSGSFAAWDIYIGIQVPGCTDPEAWNYNPDATVDDGSCEYLDGPWGLTAVPDLTGTQLDWHDPAEVPPIVQYHDDVLANAFYFYSNYEGGYAHGTRFDVDGVYDIQAVSVKILSEGDAYWPWPNETHGPVRLMVFDDNGGVPGNMIWDEYTTAVDGWATVYPGYTGMFGSFYVIASHADDWSLTGDPEGFGIDGSVDFPDNMYTLYEGLWYTDDYLGYGGDYMFTAWVGGDYGLEAISYHNEIPPAILGQDVEDNSSAVHDGSIVNTDGTESFPSYITNDLERDLIGFEIYRDGVVVGNVDAMTYSFLDEFAYDEFVDYCYVVRGVYDEGLSLPSNEACVVFLGADPDAPTNVTAEAWWDDTDVTSGITWAWDWSVPVDCQNFDCVGTCADDYLDWLADGLCDDGTWGIDFNCAEWNFDEGDCDGGGNMNVTINIFTDNYPGETWWELYDSAGNFVDGITAGDLINSATLYTWDLVLTPGTYNFTIYDYWGDGICCSYGEGYYELWVDGALIGTGGDFGAEAVHSFTIGGLLLSSSEAVYSSPIIGEKGQSDIDISGIELIRTMTYQNEVKPYVPQTRALFDLADGTHQAVNVNRDIFFTLYFDYQGDSYAFTTSDYFIDIIGFDYDIEVCGVVTATNEWNQESIPSDPPACATTVPPPTCDYVAPENFTVSDTGSSLYLEWTHPDYVDPSMVLGETMANPFIVDAVPYFDSGSTIGHLDDYDEVCPYSGSTSADVVYYWDAVPGDWTFDICESDYDTKIYVYDGNGILLGCTDDSCSNSSGNPYRSDLGLTILDYGPLYIIIDGYNGNSGNYNFEIYEGLPVLSDNDPQPVKDDDMSDMNVDRECGITHFNVYLETEEGACPPGQFMDCEGFCVDDFYLSWIGDGWCDDGTYGVYLYCEEFNWDDGDCDGEPNQSYKAPADNVQPASRNWTLIATTIYPNFEFFDVIPNQEFCFMVTADDMYLGYNESPPAGPLCNSVFVEVPNPPFDVMAEGTWYEPDNSSAIEWSWSHDQVVDCQNFDCVGTCADDYLDW
ncbi:MAG: hypothetical protein ACE5D7_04705, partial [Fidelibacterota bacterium]